MTKLGATKRVVRATINSLTSNIVGFNIEIIIIGLISKIFSLLVRYYFSTSLRADISKTIFDLAFRRRRFTRGLRSNYLRGL